MNTEHTPGPWTVEPWEYQGEPSAIPTIRTERDAIAQVCGLWRDGESDTEEREANARLLAAAPVMLAALKWVAQEIEWGHDMAASAAILSQAIAQAEGEK